MLDWLRRYLNPPEKVNATAASIAKLRVIADHDLISVAHANGQAEILRWAELAAVGLLTSQPPGEPLELSWLLQSRDRRHTLVVPMGADGERDLLQSMQARLHGFDNMAVVEAMSARGSAGFTIWDETWQGRFDDERHDRRH